MSDEQRCAKCGLLVKIEWKREHLCPYDLLVELRALQATVAALLDKLTNREG